MSRDVNRHQANRGKKNGQEAGSKDDDGFSAFNVVYLMYHGNDIQVIGPGRSLLEISPCNQKQKVTRLKPHLADLTRKPSSPPVNSKYGRIVYPSEIGTPDLSIDEGRTRGNDTLNDPEFLVMWKLEVLRVRETLILFEQQCDRRCVSSEQQFITGMNDLFRSDWRDGSSLPGDLN